MFLVIFSIFLQQTSGNELKFSKDRWYCSTESEFLLTHQNFHSVFNYNECCAINEDCYNFNLSLPLCDHHFEWCIHRVSSQYHQSYELIQQIKPYSSGGNRAHYTRQYQPYIVEKNQEIAEIYPILFIKCKTQNATISSCALEFDHCILSDEQYNCYLRLDQCLDRTFIHRVYNPYCNHAFRTVQIVINQFIETSVTQCELLI